MALHFGHHPGGVSSCCRRGSVRSRSAVRSDAWQGQRPLRFHPRAARVWQAQCKVCCANFRLDFPTTMLSCTLSSSSHDI